MIATLLRLIAFAACVAFVLEISLRIYYFGVDGLTPSRINSYRVILDSDVIQTADDPAIWYELKPNLDTLLAGKRFRTNSAGLADKEYAVEKPAGTFRIAVAGSSWSMATGVATEDAYQALLEERLAELWPDRNIEVINFGVEYYGLGEITATIREKIIAYDPDMILLGVTSTTPLIEWDDDKEPFVQNPVTPPFLQSHLISKIAWLLGHPNLYNKSVRPSVEPGRGEGSRNVTRAMKEIKTMAVDEGIDVVALSLTHTRASESAAKHIRNATSKRGIELIRLHLDTLAENAGTDRPFLTDKFSLHPNELGHQLIADEIARWLDERKDDYLE